MNGRSTNKTKNRREKIKTRIIVLFIVLLTLTLGGCFWKRHFDPKNAPAVFGTWQLEGKVKHDNTTIKGTGTMKITYQDGNTIKGWGSTMPPGLELIKVDVEGTVTDKPDNFLMVTMQVRYPPVVGDLRDVILTGIVTITATGTFINDGKIYLDSLAREIGEWKGTLKK